MKIKIDLNVKKPRLGQKIGNEGNLLFHYTNIGP
jgi:hypothetical protein